MKVAFFSNFMNHHQLPLCNALSELLGEGNFVFVASKPPTQERLELGYRNMNETTSYVLCSYKSEINAELAKSIYIEYDIVIGGDPNNFHLRLKQNKPIFIYSERIFRSKQSVVSFFRNLLIYLKYYSIHAHSNFYLLCAGAFVAKDFSKMLSFPKKKLKWGYFPEAKQYNIDKLIERKRNTTITLLWVGRLIELKHPELAIEITEKLHKLNYPVTLTLIGSGIMESEISTLILNKGLGKIVSMTGALAFDKVRLYMEDAQILLFTSDQNEGWGAVLNESMNSGCATIVDYRIGAAPFLIRNKENGFIYRTNHELFEHVKYLADNPEIREKIGENAYNTIIKEWNAKIAAKRFTSICEDVLNNKFNLNRFLSGPCSKAKKL